MNRNNAGAIGPAVFACALALLPVRAIATDARIADLAQAGKIRLALFLPQHAKDATTGELRGIGTGAVAIRIGPRLRILATLIVIRRNAHSIAFPSRRVFTRPTPNWRNVPVAVEIGRQASIASGR
jgi:hypothetical protein